MAFQSDLPSDAPVPKSLWVEYSHPAPKLLDVLSQLGHFLDQLGYTTTFVSLCAEAKKNGLTIDIAEWERGIEKRTAAPLLDLYEEWFDENKAYPSLPSATHHSAEIEESNDSEDSEDSEDDDSDATSKSDSDSSSSASDPSDSAAPVKADLKRKRVASPLSSDEDSSEDLSSSDADSDSDSSEESDERPAKRNKVSDPNPSVSDSDDSESSDDDTSSSDASSSASEDSDSEDEPTPAPPAPAAKPSEEKNEKKDKKGKKGKTSLSVDTTRGTGVKQESKDTGSQSSATLEADSANDKAVAAESPGQIHPDRLKRMPASQKEAVSRRQAAAEVKKSQVPFSRIPTDQRVDPRFASNDYVSYDYADRAYQDLSVTRGKGFTKEKNKKKRGSYRGGAIDVTPKGIKFDD